MIWIGGCDADILPAHMILRNIQDQKQKYNLFGMALAR